MSYAVAYGDHNPVILVLGDPKLGKTGSGQMAYHLPTTPPV
ncbi:MAG: hypothetical protein PHC94_01835 [Methylobacter sp.]|nr:hypothetical protein [Methylobacter sp.]